MKWVKKGLIYTPDGNTEWAKTSALTPTPVLINDEIIRVYSGFRDSKGVSRIGFVDVDANDPSRIFRISKEPVLDVGLPGTFDDNGVILGDIVRVGEHFYMYYVGFQLVDKVKFLAFSGLAISDRNGDSFVRVQKTPVLDRADEGLFIRAIHTARYENGIWKIWYAAGSDWTWIQGTPFPNYHIRYLESEDGRTFAKKGTICVSHEHNEYRIGRPRVYPHRNGYKMYYTKGDLQKNYLPGYAESVNGIHWQRMDQKVGITTSESGWDSVTLCYPSLVEHKGRTFMFYNGNNMGENGFGYAELM